MEFNFNVNKLLPKKINKISQTLTVEEFRGDRREFAECQKQLTRILDEMGEASAKAQGLNKPITSAQKLRDTDHLVYLLVDNEANHGKGSVIGLLKTGSKNLFMFDETGCHYELQPRCVLDFYVHESRQRTGCGIFLYQHMLAEEKITPVKLAIDRPSEKFLAFLRKHYGLSRIVPQNNKFVVFHGFFDGEVQDPRASRYGLSPKSFDSPSPNNNYNNNNNNNNNAGANGVQGYGGAAAASRNAYGRYAAARPACSMGNIIHNTAVLGQPAERTGIVSSSPSFSAARKPERPRSLSLYSEEEQKQRTSELSTVPTPAIPEHQPTPYVPILLEAERAEKAEKIERERNASVKTSPSCAQEVGGNEAAHLDLKFYHSPLW